MILLDTTVLAYAVGVEHPLREPSRRLLRAHAEGLLEAATTIEVIQELTHVRARKRPREEAATLARQYMSALSLLVTDRDDLELGLRAIRAFSGLGRPRCGAGGDRGKPACGSACLRGPRLR